MVGVTHSWVERDETDLKEIVRAQYQFLFTARPGKGAIPPVSSRRPCGADGHSGHFPLRLHLSQERSGWDRSSQLRIQPACPVRSRGVHAASPELRSSRGVRALLGAILLRHNIIFITTLYPLSIRKTTQAENRAIDWTSLFTRC